MSKGEQDFSVFQLCHLNYRIFTKNVIMRPQGQSAKVIKCQKNAKKHLSVVLVHENLQVQDLHIEMIK